MSDNHDHDIVQESKDTDSLNQSSVTNEGADSHAPEAHEEGKTSKSAEHDTSSGPQSGTVPSATADAASKPDSAQNISIDAGSSRPPTEATDSGSKVQDHSAVSEANNVSASASASPANSSSTMSALPNPTVHGYNNPAASQPTSKLDKWLSRSKKSK